MGSKFKLSNEKPSLKELFFPSRCIICRDIQPPAVSICPGCARNLSATGSQSKFRGDFFDGGYAPFFYEEPLRESFLRFKFRSRPQYSRQFGKWMANCLAAQEEAPFDFVTWCPLNLLRKLERGYDQAQLLADEVGRQLSLPVVSTLKKDYRTPLSSIEGNKAIRSAHIMGAYTLRRGVNVAERRILLIDDVVTSGSTMSECARILKTAGAREVVCLSLMRRRG